MTFLPLESFSFSDALSTSGLGFLIVLAVLAVLAIFVKVCFDILPRLLKKKSNDGKAETAPVKEVVKETLPAETVAETVETPVSEPSVPHIPGYVILDGVAEQDAAVLMAITSFKTGIGLERLSFNSIKRLNQDPVLENISEQDAAAIMAITSDKTGIPLENLCFNSIKLVEE
mgnify:CR=1 FL=1